MKEINRRLFSRLAQVAKDLVTQDLLDVPRAVETDAVGKKWLKNAKVKKAPYLQLGPGSQFAFVALDEQCFLATVGVELTVAAGSDLVPVSLNSGAFTLLSVELEVPLKSASNLGYELAEHIFIPLERATDKAVFFPMSMLEKYYEKILLFEIPIGSALLSDEAKEYRCALEVLLCSVQSRPMHWPSTTLERLHIMAMDKEEKAPFHLLFRMLTETRGDAAFLDVYRCIEQLFPLPKIAALTADLGVTLPAMKVARSLETHLGWRRPEIDSLIQITSNGPPALTKRLQQFFHIDVGVSDPAASVARAIYDLRNRCVHFRPLQAMEIDAEPPDWIALVDMLLELVQFLYRENSQSFSS